MSETLIDVCHFMSLSSLVIIDVRFCGSCRYSSVSLFLLWWLSTWEWTSIIYIYLTIMVKLQVAWYPIIGLMMAQSFTVRKACEVEDDADAEIAGCIGCTEPLRWRAGIYEWKCMPKYSACETRSVSSSSFEYVESLSVHSAFVKESPANSCYLS